MNLTFARVSFLEKAYETFIQKIGIHCILKSQLGIGMDGSANKVCAAKLPGAKH